MDLIPRSATLANTVDHPGVLELTEDSMDRTLGNPHRLRDFADSDVGVPGDAHEYMAVITEETPS